MLQTRISKAVRACALAIALIPWLVSCGGGSGSGGGTVAAGPTGPLWGVAAKIDASNDAASVPRIGVDGAGNVIAVWTQDDGLGNANDIWANRYGSSGWGAASNLTNTGIVDAGDAVSPQLAVNASGDAIAVWAQEDGGGVRHIWASVLSNGVWGAAARIDNNTNDADDPQIGLGANGNAIAVWVQDDGLGNNNRDVWASQYTVVGGWQMAVSVDNSSADASAPQIALDGSGNGFAVWIQALRVQSNRFDPLIPGWGAAASIQSIAEDAAEARIAADENGNAIAVWSQISATQTHIWANRYANAIWEGAQKIETNAGDSAAPQIAMNATGNALVVWEQAVTPPRLDIWSARFNALSNSWGNAQLIEADDTGDARAAQVAINANGNGFAVWEQSDQQRVNIRSNRFSAGAGWGTVQFVETADGPADSPGVVLTANGSAIAVWVQDDGTNPGKIDIVANRNQ